MEESAEELESKLSAYQGQLQQVHQLLAIDASNEQFTKLKDDLEQVISLTQALLNQVKESGASQDVQLRKKAKVEDRYSPTAAALEGEDDDQSQAAVEQQQQQLANKPLQIGDHVEVTGGERVFTGVITTIIHETEFQVKYYDFESEVALPLSSLRRIPAGAFKQDDITLGMTCQCRYALDRQYYDVTITGLTQFGYKVTYTEYGNTEEVPIEYLRPTMTLKKSSSTPADINNDYNSTAQSSSNQIAGGKKEKRDANGLIPIPENLKILPTDTEEEKKRKQKKLKGIKNRNYQIQQEQEVTKVQQSWKTFVNKGTKRVIPGLTAVKQSMFASSEANAAKVGVTNSGRGMTNYGERKKHRFDGSIVGGEDNSDDD